MKVLIKEGTETHKKLIALRDRIEKCNKKAMEAVESLGGKSIARSNHSIYIAGNVDGIVFGDVIPDKKLWKKVGNQYSDIYYPKVANKEVCRLLEKDLERVKSAELNEIISFQPHGYTNGGGMYFAGVPNLKIHEEKNIFVLNIHEGMKYKLTEDMEEILESKYNELMEVAEA